MRDSLVLAAGVVLALIVVAVSARRKEGFVVRDYLPGGLNEDPIDALEVGGRRSAETGRRTADGQTPLPQRRSVYDSTSRLYVTDEVDPLITGQGAEWRDNTRDVYAQRTAFGAGYGLQEFADDSSPGAVGVDIGPNALSEYEGSVMGYNDGIPAPWAFPSTPIRWYRPRKEDHYGHEGPAITDTRELYALYVPDHEPYIGEDPGKQTDI